MVRKYLKKAAHYALNRLKERSTRLGLVAIAASIGVSIEPSMFEQIAVVGTAVMGVIEAVWPDQPAKVVAIEE